MEWILVGGPVCACRLYKSDQSSRNFQKNTIYGLAYVIIIFDTNYDNVINQSIDIWSKL